MAVYRHKRAFTTGEVSPLITARTDIQRYKHGCFTLLNAYSLVQGPATKRTGTLFVADMTPLIADLGTITGMKLIKFEFDKNTSYALVFFTGTTSSRVFFAQYDENVVDPLQRYGLIEDPASPGNPYSVDLAPPFDIDKMDWGQAGDILTMVQHEAVPMELRRLAATGDDWEWVAPTFTDMPADWTAGDYPSVFSYYEQRSVYGSNLSRPQTLWFSKSGDFYDFGVSVPLVESDAVTYTIASGDQNRILWLNSARQLLIGTLGDEWTIWGAGAPLSFQSVQANRQTNRGSEKIKPIMIGAATLFIQRHGRDVNEFIYDFAYDSYQIQDLTILAPHLTESYSLVDWAYQQTPNSIVWAVREDGDLLGLTYQRRNKVVGWHRHNTDGNFKSVCSTPNGTNREDDLWLLVQREISGDQKYYLEVMQPEFKSDNTFEAFFVDSGLVYNDIEYPIQTVTGLEHLEGKTVSVLAEGAVHAEQTVVNGEIELYKNYGRVIVGLPYITVVQPVLTDLELATGTTHTRLQRVFDVGLELYRSLGMKIGRDIGTLEPIIKPQAAYIQVFDIDSYSHKLEEVPFRIPSDLMGQAVPLFSGVVTKSFPEGHHLDSKIYVVSYQPLPLTVVGIVDEVEVYG